MEVIKRTDNSDIATVYIARDNQGRMAEFVESTQPPLTVKDKWVLIVSTLFGCPVDCSFCDAGGSYQGRLSVDDILFQIDYPVIRRFPDRFVNTEKFKIQFSRMGEPSFNPAVLKVMELLPRKYTWKTFIPSLSSIAPQGTENFFEELLKIKNSLYRDTFQLQFSIHSSSPEQRDKWIPVKKWDFGKIARYSERFYHKEGKKITLNFAVSDNSIIESNQLIKYFTPDIFLIKLTPVNPTYKASSNRIISRISPEKGNGADLVLDLEKYGYEVIISIGEWEENRIGSNCGQYIQGYLKQCGQLPQAYNYRIVSEV